MKVHFIIQIEHLSEAKDLIVIADKHRVGACLLLLAAVAVAAVALFVLYT